jgi:hypothetical protein
MRTAPANGARNGLYALSEGMSGFAAPVAFTGEQVPGALGPGQLAAAAELPDVQVRLGYLARSF